MNFYYEETIYFSIWYAWIPLQIRKFKKKKKALRFETIEFWFIGFYKKLFEKKMFYFYITWKVEDPILCCFGWIFISLSVAFFPRKVSSFLVNKI